MSDTRKLKAKVLELEESVQKLKARPVIRGCLQGECAYQNRFMCGWFPSECGIDNNWKFWVPR